MSFFNLFGRKSQSAAKSTEAVAFEKVILFSMPESGAEQLSLWLQAYFGPQLQQGDLTTEGASLRLAPPFDLSLPQAADQRHLVVYQPDFTKVVIPAYELYLQITPGVEDSMSSFRVFASTFFADYKMILKAWVDSAFGRDQLNFTRDQLILHDRDCLRLAIWWLAPNHVIDEDRVERVLEVQPPIPDLPKPTDFRHYDKTLFSALSRLSLTRADVEKAFLSEFGRRPAESNYLQFQVQPTFENMITVMRGSAEYSKRQARLAAAQEENK